MDIPTPRTGTSAGGRPAVPRPFRGVPPVRMRAGALRKFLVAVGFLVAGVFGAAVLWVVWWLLPHTLAWREEVALQDGRTLVVSRTTVMERGGEQYGQIEGKRTLRFTHPETGAVITWANAGTLGARLQPMLLDVDQGHAYLVALAQSVRDYDDLGCPTPPYFVFRYAASGWTRIPLADLPTRFETANLLNYVDVDLIKRSRYVLTAAQIEAAYRVARTRSDTRHYAVIDRRIRNPIGLGCERGGVERAYGGTKFLEWLKTGDWLDKSAEDVAKLLGAKAKGVTP